MGLFLLRIELWVAELERVRLSFGYRAQNQAGREVLEATTVHACTSLDPKLMRLPPALCARLQPYEQRLSVES